MRTNIETLLESIDFREREITRAKLLEPYLRNDKDSLGGVSARRCRYICYTYSRRVRLPLQWFSESSSRVLQAAGQGSSEFLIAGNSSDCASYNEVVKIHDKSPMTRIE